MWTDNLGCEILQRSVGKFQRRQRRKMTRYKAVVRGRLHKLKKGLFSALKLSCLLRTGLKLELKSDTLLAHVNAP